MVKFYLSLFFLVVTVSLYSASVTIEAVIDQNQGQANFPLKGTITVTHEESEKIDDHSYVYEGEKLEVHFVKTVKIAGNIVVSIYQFFLVPKAEGQYSLTPISVKVNSKTYKSLATPYEVKTETQLHQVKRQPSQAANSEPTVFKLEGFIKGPKALYLGQRTTLVYRIYYNRDIELTKSNLPFVHAKNFQKVGDAAIRDLQTDKFSVQEISQEIEADHLGTFTLGPSEIQGYIYQKNSVGVKVKDSELLKSEIPAIEITVSPFPAVEQPASFNGSLGKVKAEVKLLNPSSYNVGDVIELSMTISGVTNLADLHLPNLACQPGFSGFFKINDLPPLAEVSEGKKQFKIELRALSSTVKAIPSIELSSFDPVSHQYHRVDTDAIPIVIEPASLKNDHAEQFFNQPLPSELVLQDMLMRPVGAPEIKGEPIVKMERPFLQRGWIYFLIPFGCLLLYLQLKIKRYLNSRPLKAVKLSQTLFKEALKNKHQPHVALKLLEQAMSAKLDESFRTQERKKEMKDFILSLQALQYSQDKIFHLEDLISKSKTYLIT